MLIRVLKSAIAIATATTLTTCTSANAEGFPSEASLAANQSKTLSGKDYFRTVGAWVYYKYHKRGFIPEGWLSAVQSRVNEVHTDTEAVQAVSDLFRSLSDPTLEVWPGDPLNGTSGIEVELKDDRSFVVSVVGKDSPAARVGVHPGDVIDKSTPPMSQCDTPRQMIDALCGAPGVKLHLPVLRNGQRLSFTIILTDKDPEPTSFCTILNGNIAYVKPALPFDSSEKLAHFKRALSELSSTQANGLILDLRNNRTDYSDPSGLCGCFVGSKQSFGVQHRKSTEYMNGSGPQLTNLPILALINSTTNTSAEALAACLKVNKRAVLLGSQTAGKGRVMSTFKIELFRQLRLSTSEYVTCEGQFIEGAGITPDISIDVRKEDVLLGPWWNCSIAGKAPNILDGKDVQLKRALSEMPNVINKK